MDTTCSKRKGKALDKVQRSQDAKPTALSRVQKVSVEKVEATEVDGEAGGRGRSRNRLKQQRKVTAHNLEVHEYKVSADCQHLQAKPLGISFSACVLREGFPAFRGLIFSALSRY